MNIYSVWDCDSCDLEYFSSSQDAKENAQRKLKECALKFNIPENQIDSLLEDLNKNRESYSIVNGIRIDLVAIDKIKVDSDIPFVLNDDICKELLRRFSKYYNISFEDIMHEFSFFNEHSVREFVKEPKNG